MNKILGLFLLALAFLAPNVAQAANRWAVCSTTCTWNNDGVTTGIMWSSVGSGGATGAAAPVAGDTVTIDAATCVGGTTCTITTFSGNIAAASINWGACTASTTGCIIDASVNNTNFTFINTDGATAFNGSGTGTRQWKAGTGTYALTSNNNNSCLSMSTVTNDTSVFSAATWTCSGSTTNARDYNGGGKSYGPTTINTNASNGSTRIVGNNTFASLTIGAPSFIKPAVGNTQTLTAGLSITGGSSSALVNITSSDENNVATLSLGAATSISWVALRAITTSGGNPLTAINCFDLKLNTLASGGSCTVPSVGGGGGRIIGG